MEVHNFGGDGSWRRLCCHGKVDTIKVLGDEVVGIGVYLANCLQSPSGERKRSLSTTKGPMPTSTNRSGVRRHGRGCWRSGAPGPSSSSHMPGRSRYTWASMIVGIDGRVDVTAVIGTETVAGHGRHEWYCGDGCWNAAPRLPTIPLFTMGYMVIAHHVMVDGLLVQPFFKSRSMVVV